MLAKSTIYSTNTPRGDGHTIDMKKLPLIVLLTFLVACGEQKVAHFTVTISNDQPFDRTEELVEVPINAISEQLILIDEEQYIILDTNGSQVPYQITHDDQLLFPATVPANGVSTYTITIGKPIEVDHFVYGRHYPESADDIAWENDRIAYRTYGSAIQNKGNRDLGYDTWVKRVPHLVVEQRYARHLDPDIQAEIIRLRKARKYKEANALHQSISYHVDHGDGLDCYEVGSTLGCGTTALMHGDNIVYPSYWSTYEIMENGPLRFTLKLTYPPLTIGKDKVVETRLISLVKGSQLNKTTISFSGLSAATPIATGLVIRSESPTSYILESTKGYIAYADPTDTDNAATDDGTIYVGAVMPKKIKEAKPVLFTNKEIKERGALGHVLAISNYKPDSQYTYYWGSGWSKYGFESMAAWTEYLDHYALLLRHPLVVSY